VRIERLSWVGLTLTALFAALGAAGVAPKWTVQPTPNPAHDSSFAAVACPSTTECVAVGSASGSGPGSVAEVWNGTAWRAERVPNPHGISSTGQVALNAVSCPSTSLCVAVGTYTPNGSELTVSRSFSAVWQDGKWTEHPTAIIHAIGLDGTDLQGVSCPSTTACMAVGTYQQGKGSGFLSEQWQGSSWSLIKTPEAPYQSVEFSGVSCPAVGTCTAVGSDQEQGPAMAAEFSNGAWTYQSTAGSTAALDGVSCPAVNDCVAVGQNYDSSDSALVEVWRGDAWRLVPTSRLAGVDLNGISCPGTTDCTAVGTRTISQTHSRGISEFWTGGKWMSQAVVDPSPGTAMNGVSCVQDSSCLAAGSYVSSDRTRTLLERN
jgi:hypothetical protein